jgi:hypothetical protein
MTLAEDRKDLEHDIEAVEDALAQARTTRDAVFTMQTEASDLVLDTINFDHDARDVEHEAGAMAEHAGEVYGLLDSLLGQLQTQLADLPDEEPCDECGELIPEDEIGQYSVCHASWCPELEKFKED